MVFLYLGGRTNVLVDKFFRLSHTEYWLLHRWLGRLAAAEGIIHGALEFERSHFYPSAIHISLLVSLSTLALLSIIYIRRAIYELFLQAHLTLSIAVLALVWLHIHPLDVFLLSCLTSSASLFLAQKVLWVIFTVRRNHGSHSLSRLDIRRFPRSGLHQPVLQIRIDVKKSWVARPREYIYLILPRLRSMGLGVLESHPFMIAWTIEDEETQLRTVVLLVQVCKGFTQRLQFANPLGSTIIDGPYGGHEVDTLVKYDKILLLSSGIGIAAQLESARYLILAHDKKTARIRRLTILWRLDTTDDFQWAEEFLLQLHDMAESRNILNIHLFHPGGNEYKIEARRENIFSRAGSVDIPWILNKEWGVEAGNMLVSVCGTPDFELQARQAVRRSPYRIDFQASDFQPSDFYREQYPVLV
ncbi:hypothetical protein EJ07DRAFT_152612 [Lizonia empirigonia]|nr:hypothetical protein EJ07DRAFT_152612 [Lizonia empirigonia]